MSTIVATGCSRPAAYKVAPRPIACEHAQRCLPAASCSRLASSVISGRSTEEQGSSRVHGNHATRIKNASNSPSVIRKGYLSAIPLTATNTMVRIFGEPPRKSAKWTHVLKVIGAAAASLLFVAGGVAVAVFSGGIAAPIVAALASIGLTLTTNAVATVVAALGGFVAVSGVSTLVRLRNQLKDADFSLAHHNKELICGVMTSVTAAAAVLLIPPLAAIPLSAVAGALLYSAGSLIATPFKEWTALQVLSDALHGFINSALFALSAVPVEIAALVATTEFTLKNLLTRFWRFVLRMLHYKLGATKAAILWYELRHCGKAAASNLLFSNLRRLKSRAKE